MANQQTISLLRDLRAYFNGAHQWAEEVIQEEEETYGEPSATDRAKEAEDTAVVSAGYLRQIDAALAEETAEDEDETPLVDDYDLMSDNERAARLHEILNGE